MWGELACRALPCLPGTVCVCFPGARLVLLLLADVVLLILADWCVCFSWRTETDRLRPMSHGVPGPDTWPLGWRVKNVEAWVVLGLVIVSYRGPLKADTCNEVGTLKIY